MNVPMLLFLLFVQAAKIANATTTLPLTASFRGNVNGFSGNAGNAEDYLFFANCKFSPDGDSFFVSTNRWADPLVKFSSGEICFTSNTSNPSLVSS